MCDSPTKREPSFRFGYVDRKDLMRIAAAERTTTKVSRSLGRPRARARRHRVDPVLRLVLQKRISRSVRRLACGAFLGDFRRVSTQSAGGKLQQRPDDRKLAEQPQH